MINILIVDDKVENLYLLQSLLDTSGFRTISAKNGVEALGLMKNNIPDLIIADILMPVMDGFTLCLECKKDEGLKNIPFFFYTATYTDEKDEEYALSLGADQFIVKPQEPDVFLKLINDFLENVKKKNFNTKKIIQNSETVVLKKYNEVLIRKIEDKMLQTEKAEKELRKYCEELKKEIDKRKKNEESLIKSEEYNRMLFNTSPIGLALCRMDGSLVDINPAYAKIIGRTIEETLKLTYWDITPEKYATQEAEQLKELEETGQYGRYEKEYIHKDGYFVPVLLQGLILERDGERFIWSSVEDISKRKEAEIALLKAKEKAEESDRLKSAFLANMSHEIRTPMNGILGFAGLLKEAELSGEQQQKYIQIIEKSGARMLNILSEIVEISKIESGAIDLQIKQVNINKIMESVYELLKPDAKNKSIILLLKNSLLLTEPIIKTDGAKLDSILINLIKNAIKYTDKGSIEFGLNPKEVDGKNFLEFYVKDTGIGISKDRQDAIFERFTQADLEDVEARQGAGLGLAIVKSYVEILGGEVWVESEKGIGSTFYFTLPYNSESKGEIVSQNDLPYEKVNSQINSKFADLKILIADDDETSLIYLSTIIKNDSNKILVASSGNEVVNICLYNPDIDLVLMDIQMPVMNGYEATQQIRKFNKEVIIVAQTAFAMAGDREKSIAAGCNDYISKPIKKEELVALIQKYFNK